MYEGPCSVMARNVRRTYEKRKGRTREHCTAFRTPHGHNIEQARHATLSQSGWWVYVVCGDCQARYKVAVSVWESEMRRRTENAAYDAWKTLGHDGYYRQTI
jgi:hypothetical protein